jgi:hypothetical protein
MFKLKYIGGFYVLEPPIMLTVTKREREVYNAGAIKNILCRQLMSISKSVQKQIIKEDLSFEDSTDDGTGKRP